MLARASSALERRFSPAIGSEESWRRGSWLTLNTSAAGRDVDPSSAMALVPVYACIRVLAEDIASLPLITYERLPGGGKRRAVEHPLYGLLHDLPNPIMTRVEFWETLVGHLLGWGNAYAQIVRGGQDYPLELWPLRPDKIKPTRTPTGGLRYVYELPSGERRTVDGSDVLHIRGLSFDGIHGYSPIKVAQEAIGLGLAAEEFGARFFGNGANAGGVLEHPATLSDAAAEHLRSSWNEMHQGLDNAHRVAILEEGMTWKRVGIPPDEAQFLETRKYQTTEIARLYRVPPHMIQDLERATFTNIEHQAIDYVKHTLAPWLVRIELAITRDLVRPDDRRKIFAEWLVDGLLRGDMQARYTAYNVARMGGWINADEIRERENMDPLPDGQGAVYWAPLNMTTAAAIAEEPSAAARAMIGAVRETRGSRPSGSSVSRRRLAERYTRLVQDAAQRIVTRECNDLRAAAERYLVRRDATDFLAWVEDYERQTLEPSIRQMLAGPYLSLADAIHDDARAQLDQDSEPLPADLEALARSILAAYSQIHGARSLAQLRQLIRRAIEAGHDPYEDVWERLDEWDERRADKIATVETNWLSNAIAIATFVALGVRRMVWTANGKACQICQEMDGRTVEITQTFLRPGDTVESEDDETSALTVTREMRHPPLHFGCTCGIEPA